MRFETFRADFVLLFDEIIKKKIIRYFSLPLKIKITFLIVSWMNPVNSSEFLANVLSNESPYECTEPLPIWVNETKKKSFSLKMLQSLSRHPPRCPHLKTINKCHSSNMTSQMIKCQVNVNPFTSIGFIKTMSINCEYL